VVFTICFLNYLEWTLTLKRWYFTLQSEIHFKSFRERPFGILFANDLHSSSTKVLIALPVALHPSSYLLLISLELREIRGESSRRRKRRADAFRSRRLCVQSGEHSDSGFDHHPHAKWPDNTECRVGAEDRGNTTYGRNPRQRWKQ